MEILQVDDYFMRNYRNSKGEVIGLYIGYFKSQGEGKGIHSPRQCLPGAGWVPVNTAVYQMAVSGRNPETVPVNKFVMGKGLDRQLYLFWYHGRGRIYASEYWNKIYLIWDGLTKKRTDGALVRVNSPVIGNTEDALKTQSDFIQLFLPLLKEYIPD
jgi:EpsI family protein